VILQELQAILLPPEQSDELGRLGIYRVLRVLGAGGMGIVVQAEDSQLQRRVALKVMRPSLAGVPTARERFLREARAVAALEHEHVVTVYQVGEEHGVPFLAMKLLKGETLQERLNREGRLGLAETLRIARQTAEGLEGAHRRGLVHRDVKPSNLWLEAPTGRVIILDFGLAHTLHNNPQLTGSGMVLGTPAYMAPEQAAGRPVDARSDLFSLGCVLYRLCTGKPAFEGPDTLAVLMALATQTPTPAHACAADVPPALSGLISALLAKDPKDRPASAGEVSRRLAAVEAGSPRTPAVRPALPKARPQGRRLLLGGLAVALLACVVGAGFWLVGAIGGRGQQSSGEIREPSALPAAEAPQRIKLLVPAYFYPGGDGLRHWERLLASAAEAEIVAVVNPDSGPGKQVDENYTAIVRRLRKAGARPIGYVSTRYGQRPLEEVKKDTSEWLRLYPEIQGFFLDEQASDASRIEYYLAASRHARATGVDTLIVSNPGTLCAPDYLARRATDVICVTEDHHEGGLRLPAGAGSEASRRFAILLYGVERQEQMQQLARQVARSRIGYLFVTNGKQPNPWGHLPPWWDAEMEVVRQANGTGGPKAP
jgi:hypothetical protein